MASFWLFVQVLKRILNWIEYAVVRLFFYLRARDVNTLEMEEDILGVCVPGMGRVSLARRMT